MSEVRLGGRKQVANGGAYDALLARFRKQTSEVLVFLLTPALRRFWAVASILVILLAGFRRRGLGPNAGSYSLPNLLRRKRRATGGMCSAASGSVEFGISHDRFQLGEQLGTGGFANVFSCRRLGTGDEYAAKVINTAKLRSAHSKQLLRREIKIMRELNHERIVNIHEHFWETGRCIIVMDLARCGDLFKKLETELEDCGEVFPGLGGSEQTSRHMARQLVDGMRYMHDHKVVHRDLKVENILLTKTTRSTERPFPELHDVKIADFGLSQIMQEGNRALSAVGTPAYVAPEVMEGRYDERVDFWSFGVILYVALCGQMPFKIGGLSPERHLHSVSKIRKCDSWRRVSTDGRAFVQGLLTVDVGARFQANECVRHPWLLGDVGLGSVRRTSMSRSSGDVRGARAGAIRRIGGRTGCAVDALKMELSDGSAVFHGDGEGGWDDVSWELAPDETVVAVLQEQDTFHDKLGDALIFYTSACRTIKLLGTDARSRNYFMVPPGRQIAGLQFDGSRLTGCGWESAVDGRGSVEQIGGRTSDAVGQVTLKLWDGVVLSYGDDFVGMEQGPWTLQPGEQITIVEQSFREWALGASLSFYTTAGRIITLRGMTARPCIRFAVPAGNQICGLGFDGGGRLVDVSTCSERGEGGFVKHPVSIKQTTCGNAVSICSNLCDLEGPATFNVLGGGNKGGMGGGAFGTFDVFATGQAPADSF